MRCWASSAVSFDALQKTSKAAKKKAEVGQLLRDTFAISTYLNGRDKEVKKEK